MVLVALLTAFLLVVQASNEYQCLHVAPGIDCTVQPGWALWCGYGASFAWLTLAVIAIIGALLCSQTHPPQDPSPLDLWNWRQLCLAGARHHRRHRRIREHLHPHQPLKALFINRWGLPCIAPLLPALPDRPILAGCCRLS